jgi:hypothetical protein
LQNQTLTVSFSRPTYKKIGSSVPGTTIKEDGRRIMYLRLVNQT